MVEHDRIAAVVSLSHAFAAVRGSGDGVLASKLSAEIERNLRILNPESVSGGGSLGGCAAVAASHRAQAAAQAQQAPALDLRGAAW